MMTTSTTMITTITMMPSPGLVHFHGAGCLNIKLLHGKERPGFRLFRLKVSGFRGLGFSH